MNQHITVKTFSNIGIYVRQFHISISLLALLAATGIAAAEDRSVLYKGETTISQVVGAAGENVATLSASAGTVVYYDSSGLPNFLLFVNITNMQYEGKSGIEGNKPQNKGRLFYQQANTNKAMPYMVEGSNNIYSYHLTLLSGY